MKFSRLFSLLALACGALWIAGCGKSGTSFSGVVPGLQAWTLNNLTFFETVDKASALGIAYVEAFPGQKVGGSIDGKMGPTLTKEQRDAVLKKLADSKVTLVSFGVANAPGEKEWRDLFTFAKDMGLQWITTEPPPDQLPMLDKLSQEFHIPLALHNHGPPSPYADPKETLKLLEKCSPNIGVCADTGHWARAGHDPIQAVALFPGRIYGLHLKDVVEFKKGARDVPYGTGVSNVGGILAQLRKQKFNGPAYIEYEARGPNQEKEVAACLDYLKRAATASEQDLTEGKVMPQGYTQKVSDLWADKRGAASQKWQQPGDLFKADLSNAELAPGSWTFENGILSAKGGGDIWTKESYKNFVLTLEFRCAEKSNSGVFLRCSDTVNWLHNAIEVQILQGGEADQKHIVGAIFDCLAPNREITINPGEWYRYSITAKDNMITVNLNGEEMLKMNLDDWKEAHRNPDGSPNKFEKAYKDMAREGKIGLQYHGSPIDFRNLKIEPLP